MSAGEGMRRIALESALLVGGANLFAELVVFGALIAPRFATLAEVPMHYWVAMYLPVFLACVFVARVLRTARGVVIASVVASGVTLLEKCALVAAELPGHTGGLATEAPARYALLLFARMMLGFLVVFTLLGALHARRRAPAMHDGERRA